MQFGDEMPRVYNPTKWRVEAKFNGQRYDFEPGEEKPIWQPEVIRHLCKSKADEGLVHLVYNDEMKKKYESFKEFKRAQVVNAFKSMRAKFEKLKSFESQAMKECYAGKYGGAEHDRSQMDPKQFERKIDELKKMQDAFNTQWAKEDAVEPVGNDRGRPRKGRRSKSEVLDGRGTDAVRESGE